MRGVFNTNITCRNSSRRYSDGEVFTFSILNAFEEEFTCAKS